MATPDTPEANNPNPETLADQPSTAIQSKAPAPEDESVIAIPPPAAAPAPDTPPKREPLSAEDLAARVRKLDLVLAGLVCVLAFFLGSFAIQNNDFWTHLATGRALVEGKYQLGADPFAHTTEGADWVNHAWLFDLVLYGVWSVGGVVGVGILRGLLMVALALVLLAIRRRDQSLWLPAVCIVPVLLAVSTRLPMGPLLASYVLLALTLYLLHRAVNDSAPFSWRGKSFSPLWLLPPLFALWVNLDGWFFLGPLTVALFLLGAWVANLWNAERGASIEDPASNPQSAIRNPQWGSLGTLGLVLLVGLAACLINPHLHRAFFLPTDLAHLEVASLNVLPESVVPGGVTMQRVADHIPVPDPLDSPFALAHWAPARGVNVAGLAYVPLLLLSLASFVFCALPARDSTAGATQRFPAGLFLVWLVLAVFAGLHVRLIPFFAIVAGPALVLNLQALARRRAPADAEPTLGDQRWALGGRQLTAAACLVLLVLVWPGWLHADPDDPRRSHRVGWEAQADPLMTQVGELVKNLTEQGTLTRGFNYSVEAGNVLPWFADSRARLYFDSRYTLFPEAAGPWAKLRRTLREEIGRGVTMERLLKRVPIQRSRMDEVDRAFRTAKINYVVLSGLDRDEESFQVMLRLLREPERWAPLLLDGRNAVFGWLDPQRATRDPFAGLALDFGRQGFGPVPAERRAPAQAPPPPAGEPGLLARYAVPPAAMSPEAATAQMHPVLYSVGGQVWQLRHQVAHGLLIERGFAWQGPLQAAAAVPPLLPGLCAYYVTSHPLVIEYAERSVESNSPAHPILAVRHARRAVAESPGDMAGHLMTAQAYETLGFAQEMEWAVPQAQRRGLARNLQRNIFSWPALRHIQRVAALQNAVRLSPDNPELRLKLTVLFLDINYLDAGLEQLQKALENRDALRPLPGQRTNTERVRELEDLLRRCEKEKQRRDDDYQLRTQGRRGVVDRLAVALLLDTNGRDPRDRADRDEKMGRGLALEALKALEEAKLDALKPEEKQAVVQWQVRLYLMLGQIPKLKEGFGDHLKGALGPIEYPMVEALLAAALGNYADADQALSQIEKEMAPALEKGGPLAAEWHKRFQKAEVVEQAAQLGAAIGGAPLDRLAPARLFWQDRLTAMPQAPREVGEAFALVRASAPLAVDARGLRALLALEQGDTAKALEHCREFRRQALHYGPLTGLPVGAFAAPILERYRAQLERHQKP
ncbi:MAG: hypothetical protein L0Z62_43180 [Gemmataceae bacterium]|nr:hypothetical protein [Gemmataceae bacterium]